MRESTQITAFWQAFLETRPQDQRSNLEYLVEDFGNTKELADELAELVKTGVKTATSMLLWEEEQDEDSIFPTVGEIDLIVDGSGEPACIIEILEVETRPFNAIDEQFAFDYGEGDRSLTWWRKEMWEYYAIECRMQGWEPSEDMPLVCLRFRLLYPINPSLPPKG
jgi:uncharacterized protein YhfF